MDRYAVSAGNFSRGNGRRSSSLLTVFRQSAMEPAVMTSHGNSDHAVQCCFESSVASATFHGKPPEVML